MDKIQLPPNAGAPADENVAAEQEAKRQQEDVMRRDMMAAILDVPARERLARIALVSPQRARQIESILVRLAQSGQIRGRVSESQLIDLLEKAEVAEGKSTASASKTTIKFQRRKDFDDDDDF